MGITCATILSACTAPITQERQTNTTWTQTTNLLPNQETMISCEDTIKNYLKNAEEIENSWIKGDTIKKWDNIVVHYIWRLDNKNVFDTSIEEVAKACGQYNPNRDYTKWLDFTVWAGQMIAGFDKGVLEMKIKETKTIEIPAKEAYGERSETQLTKIERSKMPNSDKFEEGMELYSQNWQKVRVHKITEEYITLDWNHELAWKTLIFDITIQEIK